jgi:hypothetical protein
MNIFNIENEKVLISRILFVLKIAEIFLRVYLYDDGDDDECVMKTEVLHINFSALL